MKEDFGICEMCGKRKATVFIKSNVNGVVVEKHLCSHCAEMFKQNNLMDDFGLNNIFAGLYGFSQPTTPTHIRVCKCGTTEKDVLDNYRFGCSECYKTFEDIANKFVKNLGGVTYSGEPPKHISQQEEKKPLSEIEILMQQLEDAVSKEDFLLANELKIKIKKLEGKENE